ncbi:MULTISPECIES: cupin domain-containing protein [Streptomyces]|uniref:cupin domain-containing protein n=1 Tax=Streptomyces TaxID=1883 RepID=UPI001E63D6BF|nr:MULTISPECIES: cupin domain-containing protein [Streptomyces]UFQ13954.1 cupin domain-containing protein [Streptomyces huasconensis]WCL83554.1 cupin domain-containing protein [Streptomyces sp. JCM 35825]
MTIDTSSRADETTPADAATRPPVTLADLVGDAESFLTQVWGNRTATYTCEPAKALLSMADVWRELDCGSLVAPYFGVLRQDATPTSSGVRETRIIQTKPRPGYAKPTAVREAVASGHVFVLSQLEDWNAGIGALVDGLRGECRAQVGTDAYLCAAGSAGMPARADGAHALVVQVDGRTRWVVGEGADASESVLQAGDVLYVPPGQVRRAAPDGTDTLFLLISLQQPTARDLAELALAQFLKGPAAAEIAGTHHFLSPAEKVAWLGTALRDHLTGHDRGALAEQAVRLRQREGRA